MREEKHCEWERGTVVKTVRSGTRGAGENTEEVRGNARGTVGGEGEADRSLV